MRVVVTVCSRRTSPCLSPLMSAEFTRFGTGETGTGGGDHHAGVLPPSVCGCVFLCVLL